ncbi:MAG TPA: hypothetical protein VFH80_10210, partial [Solirubrobacteraceae bacterium]|nr:hypothetical protein [Solirubrobacteraceae bacterium]
MPSTYDTTITAEASLVGYWPMNDASGTTMAADSKGANGAYTASGVTLGATGIGDGETAASFDGSSGAASVAIDLSAYTQISLEFWLKWSAFANNDALAAEYTANWNNNVGAFIIDPNSSATAAFDFNAHGSSNSAHNNFPRPSAGAWHYYVLEFD